VVVLGVLIIAVFIAVLIVAGVPFFVLSIVAGQIPFRIVVGANLETNKLMVARGGPNFMVAFVLARILRRAAHTVGRLAGSTRTVGMMLELRHKLVPITQCEQDHEQGYKHRTGAQFCHEAKVRADYSLSNRILYGPVHDRITVPLPNSVSPGP